MKFVKRSVEAAGALFKPRYGSLSYAWLVGFNFLDCSLQKQKYVKVIVGHPIHSTQQQNLKVKSHRWNEIDEEGCMSTTLRRERIKKSERARDVSCKWANSQRIYEVVYIYIYCNYGWGSENASVVALFLLNASELRTEREAFFVCVCVCMYVNEKWRAAFYCVVLLFFFLWCCTKSKVF